MVRCGEVPYTSKANWQYRWSLNRFELHGSTLHRFFFFPTRHVLHATQHVVGWSPGWGGWRLRRADCNVIRGFLTVQGLVLLTPSIVQRSPVFHFTHNHLLRNKYLFVPICSFDIWKNLFKLFLHPFKFRPWWISCSLMLLANVRLMDVISTGGK